MLAILAAPQNTGVAVNSVPLYVETLLQSFPRPLTARQFRLAIKSVVRIASPPSPVAIAMPLMQAIVLDMLRDGVEHASEDILPVNLTCRLKPTNLRLRRVFCSFLSSTVSASSQCHCWKNGYL